MENEKQNEKQSKIPVPYFIYGGIALAVVIIASLFFFHKSYHPTQADTLAVNSKGADDAAEGQVVEDPTEKILEGRDFQVTTETIDGKMSLTIQLQDGSQLDKYTSYTGESSNLADVSYKGNPEVNLVHLWSGDTREVILIKTNEELPNGQGNLRTYNLEKVDNEGLHEIASFITVREGNGLKLKGEVEIQPAFGDSAPTLKYNYNANGEKGELILKWDGNKFQDSSAALQHLDEKYLP
jgi:hypothetical protein